MQHPSSRTPHFAVLWAAANQPSLLIRACHAVALAKAGLFCAVLLCVALATPCVQAAEAYVYHGALAKDDGAALPEAARKPTLTFRLYPQAVGGEALWQETQTVTCDAEGNFVVPLGATTAGLEAVFAAVQETLYLGLTVNDGAELTPRQRLLSVPLAHRAQAAACAYQDFPIDGAATLGTLATDTLSVETLTTAADAGVHAALTAQHVVVNGPVTATGAVTVDGRLALPYGVQAPVLSGPPAALPGMIVPWYPPSADAPVPEGWLLCDGSNPEAPNLSALFVIGAGDTYAPGATGGAAKVTLTTDQVPAHEHSFTYTTGDRMYNYKWADVTPNYSAHPENNIWTNNGNTSELLSEVRSVSSVGSGKDHENRPPYRALKFIMRRKD